VGHNDAGEGSRLGVRTPIPITVHYTFETLVDGSIADQDLDGLDLKAKRSRTLLWSPGPHRRKRAGRAVARPTTGGVP
jgi:hypothetical protein